MQDIRAFDSNGWRGTGCNSYKKLQGNTSDPISSINDMILYVNSPKYPPRFRNAIPRALNARQNDPSPTSRRKREPSRFRFFSSLFRVVLSSCRLMFSKRWLINWRICSVAFER